MLRKVNMLMITNRLSFILAAAAVPMEETTSDARSRAAASLRVALNKVGTLTLIQVEFKLHTVRSAATLLDVLKWIFMLFYFLLIFVHLYRRVLGLFVLLYSCDRFWNDSALLLLLSVTPLQHLQLFHTQEEKNLCFLLQQQLYKLWIQQTLIMFTGRLCLCFNDLFLSATAAGRESASWSRPGLQRRRFKLLLTDSVRLHSFK